MGWRRGRGEGIRGDKARASASSACLITLASPAAYQVPEDRVMGPLLKSGLMFPPQAENIMFLELDVSPPAVFEMEFSHDQDQDPRALHMERLMRLDSFLERPSTSKVRKSRSWSVPSRSAWTGAGEGAEATGAAEAGGGGGGDGGWLYPKGLREGDNPGRVPIGTRYCRLLPLLLPAHP